MSCSTFALATEPKLPLPKISAMARQLHDFALVVERHRDRAEPAEHALTPEFRVEHVQMQHAIEQREDRGLRSDRRREGFDRILEIERLAAQQHDVEFLFQDVGLHRRRIFQGDVAVRAFDHKARGGKFRRASRPDQKCDVAAGLQHPAAEISADGPGANHENAHC
jgi:hypothetical protein